MTENLSRTISQGSELQKRASLKSIPANAGRGMFGDILATPAVMKSVLDSYLTASGDSQHVSIESMNKPLKDKFVGKTPLEVMAACRSPDGSYKNKITIIGCGSSYNVAVLGEYLIERIARMHVEVFYSSEYRYKCLLHQPGDVVIAISNSGKTLDTLESLKVLKRSPFGAEVLTLSIINELDTPMHAESDVNIATMAGEEAGIAATKVFSNTALSLVLLAIALGDKCGTLPETERQELLSGLARLPEQVQEVLDKEALSFKPELGSATLNPEIGDCEMWDICCQNVLAQNFIFLGRGFNFPIALEGAMKCKEIAYIHAEGYPAAEMKHGPIALIDQFMPVVFIALQSDECYDKIKCNIQEVVTRGGSVVVITDGDDAELIELCEHIIKVPRTHEYLVPLIAVIPMQLLAYMMGILRGNEVDNPRGLQKHF